jgi:gamma-glutamylcyclotransferase (GGCT)/AIG2-like uncharacterized protein YtfP
MNEKQYYFAYGSNLLMSQMAQRCSSSTPFERGILRGHKLVFKSNPAGRGVADVIKAKGEKVYGAVYEVTNEDLKKLDRYEGHPTVYYRTYVEVETRQGVIRCIAYVMQPEFKFKLPNVDYFKKIFYGYGDWHLPQKVLTERYKTFKTDEYPTNPAPAVIKKAVSSKSKNKGNKNNKSGGAKPYKSRTPFGYEPAIKWV